MCAHERRIQRDPDVVPECACAVQQGYGTFGRAGAVRDRIGSGVPCWGWCPHVVGDIWHENMLQRVLVDAGHDKGGRGCVFALWVGCGWPCSFDWGM